MGRQRISNAEELRQFAAALAQQLSTPSALTLHGEMGVGKTTFVQGLVRGLGGDERTVHSPTFGYLHIYTTPIAEVFHFDLYRLRTTEECLAMGFLEYLEQGIVVIEWPELMLPYLHDSCSMQGKTDSSSRFSIPQLRAIHLFHETLDTRIVETTL